MKSKRARVMNNGELAGYLSRTTEGYVFTYDNGYFGDASRPAISLTLPKKTREYRSRTLFPFFFGLLAEGENKRAQCRFLKIDEDDHFTRLLKTAGTETIGAVTIREDDEAD